MRSLGAAVAVLLMFVAPATAQVPAVAPAPAPLPAATATFSGQGMWIWEVARSEGGDVEAIAARAASAGMTHVVVKAAHGTVWWPQFSSSLAEALHAAGLRVCAYQRALARRPGSEARVVDVVADCVVIDA